jgi:putative two-component system response regulator
MSHQDLQLMSSSNGGPEFKAALSRIAAELHRRVSLAAAGGGADFFLSALKSLAAIRGGGQSELRTSSLYDCGVYFYLNDRTAEGLHAAHLLIELTKRTAKTEWQRKAYNLRGMIQAESGDVANAVISYSTALEIAQALKDLIAQAKVLINLGVAFNYGALYHDAIPCFQRALKNANGQHAEQEVCAALSNLAQTYFFLGNHRQGYELIQQALRNSPQSLEAFASASLTIREFTAFRLAVEIGDMKAAKAHVDRCVGHSVVGGTVRSKFVAQLACGLYDIYNNSAERGLNLLNQALHRSGRNGAYYEEALSALVRAYDSVGEPELALEHIELLRHHLTKMRGNAVATFNTQQNASDLIALQLQESKLRTKVALRAVAYSQTEMLERMAVTADLKEEASGEHGYRVGRLSALMAQRLGWTKEACRAIDLAARLHDIGKIAMPDRILLTSEQLKDAERHLMSTHALVGSELLAKSNIPELQMAEEIAKFHHEWWNGEGYPARRKQKRIPIHARIVALADVFDALTHGRPFSAAWPIDRAIEEIRSRRGTQFDPELCDTFLDLVESLRAEHEDLDEYLGKAGKSSPFLQARKKIRLMLAEPLTDVASPSHQEPAAVH